MESHERPGEGEAPSPVVPRIDRRAFVARMSVAAGSLALGLSPRRASAVVVPLPPASAFGSEVPAAWFDLALDLVRSTPGYTPPVASRAFGYAGITLYEAVAPGLPESRGLAGRLNGLMPLNRRSHRAYDWPTVANSALARILRSLFPTAPPTLLAAIDDLEHRVSRDARATLAPGIHRRSVERGAEVAYHVFAWSMTDGGHEAFLRNFPPYEAPRGPGLWRPTPPGFLPALQPYWGSNRPFVLTPEALCAAHRPPRFSARTGSPFHDEAYECYVAVNELTPEQEAIARFWSDDPGLTPTPPGHSVSIATQVVRSLGVSLDRGAETYAKVGIAVADAFISCWRTKYRYNLLRPVTYVNRIIDATWSPLLITPPFPEYTSGHSIQSAAAATVLTDLFGEVPFTDRTHEAQGLAPRSFQSFARAAEEAAISRMYGGIHFRAAVEVGLEQGRCIGQKMNATF
jgi:PAP2 superfamily protein